MTRHSNDCGARSSVKSQTENSPTLTVVESIAEKEDVDALDLRPPLHNTVDTEALDQIIESMNGDGHVEFHYQAYLVSVSRSGEVEIVEKSEIS